MLLLKVAAAASCDDAITKLVIVAVTNPSHMSNCRALPSLEATVTYCVLRLTKYTKLIDSFCYVSFIAGGVSNPEYTALNCRKSNIQ